MKTPINQDGKAESPTLSGTNQSRVKIQNEHGPGEVGNYGEGKGKARIADSFPAKRNMNTSNEGKY